MKEAKQEPEPNDQESPERNTIYLDTNNPEHTTITITLMPFDYEKVGHILNLNDK